MITIPTSKYFSLHQLTDGVYAAIGKEGSPAFSNVGIVDTGDHTLVFDTFNTPRAAEDLRRAAEIITGRTVEFVIISHAHSDHWMGNQVFADDTSILATSQTHDAMAAWVDYFKDLKRNTDEYEAYIGEIEERLTEATDERLQAHLSWSLTIERHELEQLRSTRPHLPNQIFDGRLNFHGSKRTVELVASGPGHTNSDAMLFLPDDAMAFIGDLGFFRTHPYLGSSVPEGWMKTLEMLNASEFETFVPGHGPVGGKDDLLALKEYLLLLQALAAEVVQRGGSEDEAAASTVPEISNAWAGFGRFEKSMRFLFRQLAGNKDLAEV